MKEAVTVAIINYNGTQYLKEEIESIYNSDYPRLSIILADDCSTDGSVEFVKKHFPDVRIITMEKNERLFGKYPLANRVRNVVLRDAETRLVYLLDNDVILAPDCISRLVEVIEGKDDCGVCTPRVMYSDQRDTIYADGALLHFTGTSIVRNHDKKLSGEPEPPKYSLGCGMQMVDRLLAEKVGYTDPHFVIGWGDDGEFHHRMNIAGYRCYNVPQAMVYHPRKKAPFATMAHIKNRWWIILTSYAGRTILLLAPIFLIYEIVVLFFLLSKGGLGCYFLAIKDIWLHRKAIMESRKRTQSLRRISDRELLSGGDLFTSTRHVGRNPFTGMGLRLFNGMLAGYWYVVRRLL